jgi:cytoskeletal protein CcmA (bactofilin family)
MFNKRQDESPETGDYESTTPMMSTDPNVRTRRTSVIGPTLKFKGELTANEDLIIEGEIEGTIAHQDKNLTVGKEGRVKADIAAKTVEIYGKVEGNIHGDDLVKLARSSDVRGNIRCQRIIMDDGAHFDGSIEMERKKARTSSDPTKLPVSEAPEKAKSAG